MSVFDDPALDEIAPLAVWDVREASWWPLQEERCGWLRAAGLTPLKLYRIEFWLTDAPFARVWAYALSEQGKPAWNEQHMRYIADPGKPHDHSGCDAAREPPRDVPLDALPPEELW